MNESKTFVESYFSGTKGDFNGEFLRRNGLVGFPNTTAKESDTLRILEVRKMRLKGLLSSFKGKYPEIKFKMWKGPALKKYYPPEIKRVYSDIDLIVRKDDFQKMKKCLKRDNESLIYGSDALQIELKYDFSDRFYSFFAPVSRRKMLSLPWRKEEEFQDELDPATHFILLCSHNFTHLFTRLDRFFDLYFVISAKDFKWKRVFLLANRADLMWVIRANLFLMKKLGFPVHGPEDPTSMEKYLLLRLFKRKRAIFRILLIMLHLSPPAATLFFLQKLLYLDIPYTFKLLKRWRSTAFNGRNII